LNEAERLDPRFQQTYVYRGNVYLLESDFARAAADFRRALELNPVDTAARTGLQMAQNQVTPRL
jgi:tetratricopeptide (TPR) repeat protein